MGGDASMGALNVLTLFLDEHGAFLCASVKDKELSHKYELEL